MGEQNEKTLQRQYLENNSTTVMIKYFSTKEDLKSLCEPFGTVLRVKQPKDHLGFVTFEKNEEARKAIKALHKKVASDGRKLSVKMTITKAKVKKKVYNVLLVRNIDGEKNKDLLEKVLKAKYGDGVEFHRFVKACNYMFVSFQKSEDHDGFLKECEELESEETYEYVYDGGKVLLEVEKRGIPTLPDGFTGTKTRIFIGNIAHTFEEACVLQFFAKLDKLIHVQIPKRRDGLTKGIAFVDYGSALGVQRALLKHGFEYKDRNLRVTESTTTKTTHAKPNGELFLSGMVTEKNFFNTLPKNAGSDKSEFTGTTDTVFIGNLSFEATEDDIRKDFSECGEVTDVRIPYRDGQHRGCGFVEFSSTEGVKKALEFHHTDYFGRKIRVNEQPNDKDESRKRSAPEENGKRQRKKFNPFE